MRPVVLEMDGFASFRSKSVVRFDDVDYFALVGPTGAGKSTVLDAIAFSLYGSVARWDDARAVEPALAPTVNRGSVRLVFEARGERYVVLRELRRSPAGRVNQKTARLERLADRSATGGLDDAVEVVADGIGDTGRAVEDLLGLDFNQFTKCVALPQGEFAEFLHAKPADRDRILTRLLGLDVYLRLGKVASARSSRLGTEADTLQAQLDREAADAGDDVLAAAQEAHARLAGLTSRVDADVAALVTAQDGLRALAATLEGHDRAVTALRGLAVPDDVEGLDGELAAARDAAAAAASALDAAEAAETTARQAVDAHVPRATLQRWADQHADRARHEAGLPDLVLGAAQALEARTAALAARETASEALGAARDAESTARAEAEAAKGAWQAARDEAAALAAVSAPAGLDDLLVAVGGAQDDVAAAASAVSEAREALRAASQRAAGLPDAVTVDRAARDLTAVTAATAGVSAALAQLAAAHATARATAASAAEGRHLLAEAERAAEEVRTRSAAAGLRASLHEGGPCPVCEQTVHVVPAPTATTDLDAAAEALDAARAAATDADLAAARADTALAGATGALASAADRLAQSRAAAAGSLSAVPALAGTQLPAAPDAAHAAAVTTAATVDDVTASVDAVRGRLAALDDAVAVVVGATTALHAERRTADETVTAARSTLDAAEARARSAQETASALADRVRSARAELGRARDPLVALGVPELDDSDLAAAWAQLTGWARTTAEKAGRAADEARAVADRAAQTHALATAGLAAAQEAATVAQSGYDDALKAHESAAAEQASVARQLEELARLLAAAPPSGDVATTLAALAELEAQAGAAGAARVAAREGRDAADRRLASLGQRQQEAREQLTAARDPLVALGAPALPDGLPLAQAWERLGSWATSAAAERDRARAAVAAEHEERTAAAAVLGEALRGVLAEAGVDVSDQRPVSVWALAAVARAQAAAETAVRDVEAARARCAGLRTRIATTRAQAQVAADLARLLAVNGFPRWLTKHALGVLVTAASATLMELSGGQFELDLGDDSAVSFTVVDHADADAVRPVKTLSGGETFQASLALALALSTHLGALASNGAAQLEAIFVDEGFGTLDETTLDTVATTLETLATGAGRMVGVITHVPALAARVPVRFAVERDPRGSSIRRIDA